MEQEYSLAEDKIASSKYALAVYNELQNMGFGLKELKLLKSTVMEISISNKINPCSAVKKFFDDIKEQYDSKLGFEKKIREMNTSLLQAQQQHQYISLKYSQMKNVNDKLAELLAYGVTQNEIIYWADIMKKYNLEISSLHQDLVRYGTLITACNYITAKVVSLTSEYNALKKRVQDLSQEQRRISDLLESQVGEVGKAIQIFLQNLNSQINNATKTSVQTIQDIMEQSLAISEGGKLGLQLSMQRLSSNLTYFKRLELLQSFLPLSKLQEARMLIWTN
jgi:hypothetical protein